MATIQDLNLYQFAQEVSGASLRVVGPLPDGSFTVTSDELTEQELQAALDAHVPDPEVQPPAIEPEPTDAERIAELEAALNALAGSGE